MTDALAADTWTQLVAAMQDTEPSCAEDGRFTLDVEQLHFQELRHLRNICAACPLLTACAAYATTARPRGGLWAGRYYTPKSWNKP